MTLSPRTVGCHRDRVLAVICIVLILSYWLMQCLPALMGYDDRNDHKTKNSGLVKSKRIETLEQTEHRIEKSALSIESVDHKIEQWIKLENAKRKVELAISTIPDNIAQKIFTQPPLVITTAPPQLVHRTRLLTRSRCSSNRLRLLILIFVHAEDVESRKSIRMTWGPDRRETVSTSARWRTWFVIGRRKDPLLKRQLEWESKQYRDIVHGNFTDDQLNQSYKVEVAMEWAHLYCTFDYLFKADANTFIHLSNFLELLDQINPNWFVVAGGVESDLYAGFVHSPDLISRSGQYAVPYAVYNESMHPKYCDGAGFLMTPASVSRIQAHFDLRNSFKEADIYMGVLVKRGGMWPWSIEEHLHWFSKEELKSQVFSRSCNRHTIIGISYIIQHPVRSRACMWQLFTNSMYRLKEEK